LNTAPGDEVVKLEAVRIVDFQGCPVENLSTTQSASIEIEFVVFQGGKYLKPNLLLKGGSGNALFWSTDTNPALRRMPLDEGKYKSSMLIPTDFLAPGTISISNRNRTNASGLERHARAADVISLNVVDDFSEHSIRCGYQGPIPGFVRPRMTWTMQRREENNMNRFDISLCAIGQP
jgi:hypothetical protein